MASRPSWQDRIRGNAERLSESGRQAVGLGIGLGLPVLLYTLATWFSPSLTFDEPLERRVATRTLDVVPVDLARGQALAVRVAQHGVDVEVRLLDPTGRELAAVDSPFGTRGTEALYAVAGRSGRHRLELRLSPSRGHDARYVLTLERPRRARATDWKRFRAVRLVRWGDATERRDPALAYEIFHRAATLLDPLAKELRAVALFQAGEMAEKLKQWVPARDLYIAEVGLGGAVERGRGFFEIGKIEGELGHPAEALEAYDRSFREAQAAGDLLTAAKALNERGVLYQNAGKPEHAVDALFQALARWPAGEEPENLVLTLGNLGKLYGLLGQKRLARVYFLRALETADKQPDPDSAVKAISRLIQYSTRFEESLAWFRKARSYRPGAKVQAELDLSWGVRLVEAGHLPEARQELEKAAALAEREQDPDSLWNARANLAYLLAREGHEPEALALFADALRYYGRIKDVHGISTILYGRAQALRDLKRFAEARSEIRRALELAESVRLEEGGRTVRQRYSAGIQDVYELAIALAMQDGEDERALELAEQARARALLENLGERRLKALPIPAALAARRDRLKREIAETHLQGELARLGAPTRSATAHGAPALDRLFAELLEVQAEIELRTDPRGQSLVAERPLTLAEIQRHLDADTVLLAYSLGAEQSFGWVVSSSARVGKELGPKAAIEEAARAAYAQLRLPPGDRNADPAAARRGLALLSRTLLAPFAESLRGKRLVILADGALAYLPFGVLPDPDDAAGVAPLGLAHDLTFAPSASVAILLNQTAGRRPWPPRSLALLGDPVYDYGDERLGSLCSANGPPPAPAARGREGAGLLEIQRLRHAGEEARGIAGLFAHPFVALDFDARRDLVLDGRLRSYEAVHFATHGFAQPEESQLSGIVLSLIDRDGRRQDGFLRALDIDDLELSASLVVLSGCETGLGEEVEGEGIVGLVRAFFHAGAPRVVASLWNVDDEATATLMTRFYEGIERRGLSASAALRAAQQEVRRNPRWQEPYYWAGFVLEGAWR
jgi:CHAT domain-containing protein/tetratricopeptide (TPR) repeat protein